MTERRDGADVCPMCLTEMVAPAYSCPKCGALVDSAGIIEPALPPPDPKWRLKKAKWQALLTIFLVSLLIFPVSLDSKRGLWMRILQVAVYLALAWKSWRNYRAIKAETTSTR